VYTRFLIFLLLFSGAIAALDTDVVVPVKGTLSPLAGTTGDSLNPALVQQTTAAAPDSTGGGGTSDTKTVSKPPAPGGRDSVLRTILSSIEKEGVAPDKTPAPLTEQSVQDRTHETTRNRVSSTYESVILWIRGHGIATAVAVFLLVALPAVWFGIRRVRSEKSEQRFMTTTRLSLMDGEVQRACLYIEKNYMDTALTPVSVCTSIITGQPFMETMFERELGMGVSDYIDQVRMHHALQLIRWNSTADASFVASQVGYNDGAEFEKRLKMSTGNDLETFRGEQVISSDKPS
jgi:AraC-like DNA-binding protein